VTVPAQDTYIWCFAVKFGGVISSGSQAIAYFQDGSTRHVSINLVNAKITAWMGAENSGTQLAQAIKQVRAGIWYHVQIKTKIDNSAGTFELRVDGSTSSPRGIPATTGLDTQNGGSAQITRCYLNTHQNTLDNIFTDVVLLDTTGPVHNDFPGDNQVTIKFPNANGNYAQFTPLSGSNYQNVDDPTPDGDTTYNSSSTVGNKDTYLHSALAVTGDIIGVKHNYMHRKTDPGLREVASLARSGGNDYVGSTVTCGSDYYMDSEMYEFDPDTGLPWVPADLDAAEFGIEVIT
jgi:hypothetical protein